MAAAEYNAIPHGRENVCGGEDGCWAVVASVNWARHVAWHHDLNSALEALVEAVEVDATATPRTPGA